MHPIKPLICIHMEMAISLFVYLRTTFCYTCNSRKLSTSSYLSCFLLGHVGINSRNLKPKVGIFNIGHVSCGQEA